MRTSLLTLAAVTGLAIPASAEAGYFTITRSCHDDISRCVGLRESQVSATTTGKGHDFPFLLMPNDQGGTDIGQFWFCYGETCYYLSQVENIEAVTDNPLHRLATLDLDNDGAQDLVLVGKDDDLVVWYGPHVLGQPIDAFQDADDYIPAPASAVDFGVEVNPVDYGSFDALWVKDGNKNWFPYFFGNI